MATLALLRIKNLALVDHLQLEFGPGFNVITGETGAGKSILFGALKLVLGGRSDRDLIREGAENASVEAVFSVQDLDFPLGEFLEENGLDPCQDNELILKRALSVNGVNRQFINGSPTTIKILSCIGEHLVDIHGPHDHQSLLHSNRQLDFLDDFGSLTRERAKFAALLKDWRNAVSEKSGLTGDEGDLERRLDLLRFQAREIESASLAPEEEETLEADYARLSNASQLLASCQECLEVLDGESGGLTELSGKAGREIQAMAAIDGAARSLQDLHEQLAECLKELIGALGNYAERVDSDPERTAALEERINLVNRIKKKYGGSVEAALEFLKNVQSQISEIEGRETYLAELDVRIRQMETGVMQSASRLSASRQKASRAFKAEVARELKELGFLKCQFDIHFHAFKTGMEGLELTGGDSVEFLFSPNPGESMKPLRSIASSGELARVMLALKTVLAAQDRIPVLLFDEVDANVGGETARKVGDKMRLLGKSHQVFCVTHLAPVAACSSEHFLVSKETKSNRTLSSVVKLAHGMREGEIARMLGGKSEASLRHARELLESLPA